MLCENVWASENWKWLAKLLATRRRGTDCGITLRSSIHIPENSKLFGKKIIREIYSLWLGLMKTHVNRHAETLILIGTLAAYMHFNSMVFLWFLWVRSFIELWCRIRCWPCSSNELHNGLTLKFYRRQIWESEYEKMNFRHPSCTRKKWKRLKLFIIIPEIWEHVVCIYGAHFYRP